MTDFKSLIDDIARVSSARETNSEADVASLIFEHGREASHYIWEHHYANNDVRRRLEEQLCHKSLEFQRAVAITKASLAEELAASNRRRELLRVNNPEYYKDHTLV